MARLRAVVVIQAPGLSGMPRCRPRLERGDERLLDRLLGEIEVAEDADEGRDRSPGLLAEQAIDDRAGSVRRHQGLDRGPAQLAAAVAAGASTPMFGRSQIGRTSTQPCVAPGIRAARAIASSRSEASTM